MILIMDREVVKKYSGECEGVGGSKERETHTQREREVGGEREQCLSIIIFMTHRRWILHVASQIVSRVWPTYPRTPINCAHWILTGPVEILNIAWLMHMHVYNIVSVQILCRCKAHIGYMLHITLSKLHCGTVFTYMSLAIDYRGLYYQQVIL